MKKYFFLIFLIIFAVSCDIPDSEKPQPTLEQKISAMIMTGFHGTNQSDSWVQITAREIKNGSLGGVIFFAYNIENKEQTIRLNKYFQSLNNEPLLIALDNEGGRVRRLTKAKGFQEFLSHKETAEKLSPKEAYKQYSQMAEMIKDAGFNVNLAPVVDIDTSPPCPVIGGLQRSFSEDKKTVITYAEKMVAAQKKKKIISALKHFPGHGSAKDDTHKDISDITLVWSEEELIPFLTVSKKKENYCMIMTSHLINARFDENYPFTISAPSVKKLLRDKGFNGVIISDDMHMGAILKNYGLEEAVIKAVNADIDILIFSNNPAAAQGVDDFTPDPYIARNIRKIILNAVRDGKIHEKTIHNSYERIQKLKEFLK